MHEYVRQRPDAAELTGRLPHFNATTNAVELLRAGEGFGWSQLGSYPRNRPRQLRSSSTPLPVLRQRLRPRLRPCRGRRRGSGQKLIY